MADDPIRVLLADLARVPIGTPGGHQSVLESQVVDAGHDVEQVRAWVLAHGGTIGPAHTVARTGLRPNRVLRDDRFVSARYVIPDAALADPQG